MHDKTAEAVLEGHKSPSDKRIRQEQIQALMERTNFVTTRTENTTSTFVHAYLDGVFYLGSGHSACVDPANFDAQIGEAIAMGKAVNVVREKLWELEGYRLFMGDLPNVAG